MAHVVINGKPYDYDAPLSLEALLVGLDYETGSIAVAIGGQFIPRSQYDHTMLMEGQQLDIVGPMQGG